MRNDPEFIKMALAYSEEAKKPTPNPPIVWLDHAWFTRRK